MNLGDGRRSLVLENEVSCSGERPALGEDVDVGVDGDDFGLRKVLVLLIVALVLGLDLAAGFGVDIAVQDMGVVKEPAAAANHKQQKKDSGRRQARCAHASELEPGAPALLSTATSDRDRDHTEQSGEGQPVGGRPEQGGNEMSVSVHVGIGGAGGVADQVERVLPSEALQNGNDDEDGDDNAMADE